MQPLDKALRNQLESTVKQARELAESAARASLEQLGVSESNPFAHLNEQERELRRRLRAHGRQLGDSLNSSNQTQTMRRLIEEVAYEHWHRMLFARFLAENNLLMYPDPDDPVAISLEECEDLAIDEGAANGWELASHYAAQMLPQIFRPDSPVFDLTLPPEYQQKLEHILSNLSLDVFTASDSLGWVYQFWQAKKKDEVNASEVKVGAQELPAVTQLFTEPYMVSFLLDNALGAWWAARILTEEDLTTAQDEDVLRQKASIDGVPLKYLRFVQEDDDIGSKRWTPAAGTFDAWPKQLAELKTIDPSCGSGHFLVAIFSMLVPMRMQLENLAARDAVDAVLRENINGLELDQRCVELAAFALALAAWKYPDAGGYRPLPELNIACSGLSISAKKEEWLALAGDNTNLRIGLEELYTQFKDAPLLGSLIDPRASLNNNSLFDIEWEDISQLISKALADEGFDQLEIAVVAKGVTKSALLLAEKYNWIVTNVPYLGMKRMTPYLYEFSEKNFQKSKADLATIFLERWINSSNYGTNISMVMPQNWLFLGSYQQFRLEILQKNTLNYAILLGPGAFETISGEVVKATLFSVTIKEPSQNCVTFGIDVSYEPKPDDKAYALINSQLEKSNQSKIIDNPDHRIVINQTSNDPLLEDFSISKRGVVNGDNEKWLLKHWEILHNESFNHWKPIQSAVNNSVHYGGRESYIDWSKTGNGMLRPGLKNPTYGKYGAALSRMSKLPVTLYTGELYDQNTAVIVANDLNHLPAILCYAEHESFNKNVRRIDKKVGVTPATFLKIPFNLKYWTEIAEDKYPNGLPKPYSDDPTQWIFHGHPFGSVIWNEEERQTTKGSLRTDDTVLQVAVARLLGYRWPAESNEEMGLADEQREWVNLCDSLLPFADQDGIVCIPAVRGEASAVDRLLNMLAAAYGSAWSNDVSAELLKRADHAGKSLETWLRDKFFIQHCKLFNHRPFIWHIWDGLPDGFSALVNYHKLDRKNLETLIYTYLGDWISRQKQDITGNVDGSDERLVAAENLKKKLELILHGEAPYDIFVRWRTLKQQPIGWEPDLNDGVRLNIRPFMSVPDIRKKDAGVLRDKPNIKWDKDRGKDVESAPWYHLGLQYGGKEGDRINDHHLTLVEKQVARERSE